MVGNIKTLTHNLNIQNLKLQRSKFYFGESSVSHSSLCRRFLWPNPAVISWKTVYTVCCAYTEKASVKIVPNKSKSSAITQITNRHKNCWATYR